MDKVIGLRELATKCGLSKATVSMAMRNHPDIASATRQRVREMAAEIGYRPQPFLSRVSVNQLSKSRKRSGLAEVAIISFSKTSKSSHSLDAHQRFVQRIESFSNNLGYDPKLVLLDAGPAGPERLSDKLYRQGIEAVISMPSNRVDFAENFKWEPFYCVGIGSGHKDPPINLITEDTFGNVSEAWRLARRCGYTRIGLILFKEPLLVLDQKLAMAAMLQCMEMEPECPKLKLLFVNEEPVDAVRDWLNTERPECVIGYNDGAYWWLHHAGVKIPDDISFISLHTNENSLTPVTTGFHNTYESRFEFALLQLDHQIRHFERGRPLLQKKILITMHWRDGETLRLKQD